MRKKFNLTGFVVAGAAALFLGIAGNSEAIPISTQKDLDAAMRPWILKRDQIASEVVFSFDRSSRDQGIASPTASFSLRPVPAQNAGEPRDFRSWNLHHRGHGGSPTSPPKPGQHPNDSPASVPDGGATGLMLGVSCGLVFLERKLKARSGFTTVRESDLGRGHSSSPLFQAPPVSADRLMR